MVGLLDPMEADGVNRVNYGVYFKSVKSFAYKEGF